MPGIQRELPAQQALVLRKVDSCSYRQQPWYTSDMVKYVKHIQETYEFWMIMMQYYRWQLITIKKEGPMNFGCSFVFLIKILDDCDVIYYGSHVPLLKQIICL